MIRSSVRSAGLALLLTMNGCGALMSSSTGAKAPGLNVAEAALDGGAGQIALQVSDGVLRDSPNNIRALEIKGDALTLLGDYDQAGQIFQALLAKDPNSARAGIGLGRVKLAKDPAAAEQLFQRVLQRDPKNITALNNLGIARDLQGRHAQAQPAYREALAVNPDLESAQVNLALSMAMSGQGPAAIKLLQAKATQPGAPSKVKHDYAVVLAMAGDRGRAERVLSDDMPPDQAHQLLDSATGTHTKVNAGNNAFASAQRDDEVLPDVVQVPEVTSAPMVAGKTPRAMAAALAAPPPMIVRPRADAQPDSDTPTMQPVNPVAAAVTNQQPLALPIRATPANPAPVTRVAATVSDAAAVTPEVVAMPRSRPAPTNAPRGDAIADGGLVALPEAAPPPPTPLPPAHHPLNVSGTEPPVLPASTAGRGRSENASVSIARSDSAQPEVAKVAARSPMVQGDRNSAQAAPTALASPPTVLASAAIAPVHAAPRPQATVVPHAASARSGDVATETGPARSDETATMVQFAAAPSMEAAHSYWQSLVHRFPDDLGHREPVVIRFEHDGAVFWRLRAEGFTSLSDAQTLCARMRAGGQACFVPRS
ncbi:MAG TPA: tetratricopeptide repeat protein [Acetobacteraceae bacterium]|nr:tetratricopeptide repeat protein [Acetobacteraceae bacterium]